MADYDYWSQYGFAPEYAEAFEKLGIHSIAALRERAPELEKDYGLYGLCEVMGVPNTIAEAQEKAREQQYRSQMDKESRDDFQPEKNIMVCIYGPPPRKNIFRKLKDLLIP